jgi:hypothetical protein
MFCFICNKEIDYSENVFPQLHLVKFHNITAKDYFDKYLKEDGEEICRECGKETKFLGIGKTQRYRKYCSLKCSNSSKSKKELTKRVLKEKYGDENFVNVKKMKETNLEKYGVECTIHSVKSQRSISDLRINQRFNRIKDKIKEQNLQIIDIINPKKYKIQCNVCQNDFEMNNETFYLRGLIGVKFCPICNPSNNYSHQEKQLLSFVKENYNKIIEENKRNLISPYELDIYIPDLKLAFEFNGLYWHNELNKSNNYHLNKTELCEQKGIHLIQIYEDDWIYKQDIVKSRILNLLGKSKKIYARNTELKEVSYKDSKKFLENNHLQCNCMSSVRIGLYCNNELVSLMTFGGLRKNLGQNVKEGSFELLRFCNKLNTTVIGGANKLFKFFINNYSLKEVISYADRSWTMNNGNTLYNHLGFNLESISKQNYYYINNNIRENRFKYRKDVLVEQGFDKNKTEHQIMSERGIYRIYNSGQLKYKYLKSCYKNEC